MAARTRPAIAQSPAIQRPAAITASVVLLALRGAASGPTAPRGSGEVGGVVIVISLVIPNHWFVATVGVAPRAALTAEPSGGIGPMAVAPARRPHA